MKFTLRRLRLNQGGYTDKGQYYGVGMPLYEYQDVETGDIADEIRAFGREDAKVVIRTRHPGATFYS